MQHGAAAELLARLPLLRGIGSEFLSAIQSISVPQHFTTHDTIAVAGMSADATLVILEGQVALYTEEGRQFGEPLGPGLAICEMAMIVETRHYFSVAAISDGIALSIARDELGRFMRKFPWLAADLAKNVGRVLAETAATLNQLEDMLHPSQLALLQVEGGARPDLVVALEEGDTASAESGKKGEFRPIDGAAIEKVKRIADQHARRAKAHDLLSELQDATSLSDRTRPERGRDLMVSPNRELRQSHAK